MLSRAVFTQARLFLLVVFCSMAALSGPVAAASSRPYDKMVGCWTGTAEMYDQQGQLLGSTTSTGSVRWTTPYSVMHFKQTEGGSTMEYDLQINGKTATFRSNDKDVTGTELNPDAYFFYLHFKAPADQAGGWYNSHYFTGPGKRKVFGSFEPAGQNGEVGRIAVQTLTRVSCTSARRRR